LVIAVPLAPWSVRATPVWLGLMFSNSLPAEFLRAVRWHIRIINEVIDSSPLQATPPIQQMPFRLA
jgi:hypothetical protein